MTNSNTLNALKERVMIDYAKTFIMKYTPEGLVAPQPGDTDNKELIAKLGELIQLEFEAKTGLSFESFCSIAKKAVGEVITEVSLMTQDDLKDKPTHEEVLGRLEKKLDEHGITEFLSPDSDEYKRQEDEYLRANNEGKYFLIEDELENPYNGYDEYAVEHSQDSLLYYYDDYEMVEPLYDLVPYEDVMYHVDMKIRTISFDVKFRTMREAVKFIADKYFHEFDIYPKPRLEMYLKSFCYNHCMRYSRDLDYSTLMLKEIEVMMYHLGYNYVTIAVKEKGARSKVFNVWAANEDIKNKRYVVISDRCVPNNTIVPGSSKYETEEILERLCGGNR